MCKINLVFVKDEKSKKILDENGYCEFPAQYDGYTPYSRPPCNCDSFTNRSSNKPNLTYEAYVKLEAKILKDAEYLAKNHPKMKEAYLKDKKVYIEKLNAYTAEISKLEQELISKMDNMSKEDEAKYRNEYAKLVEQEKEITSRPEYIQLEKELSDFIQEHLQIELATMYYVSESDLPQDLQLLDLDYDKYALPTFENRIKQTLDSLENAKQEFETYKSLFKNLLTVEDNILFAVVFDSPSELTRIKEISIDSLTIDDLARLKYDQVICIIK